MEKLALLRERQMERRRMIIYMPPSEDEASLDDDEFVVPEDPVEQERFKRRLMAMANSLKKKQPQLQGDQDLLADRWTEVLAAEEYELERPSKS